MNQLGIPFAPDPQEISMMAALDAGDHYLVASAGTNAFELWDRLANEGYATKQHCPNAGDVHQFSVSLKGRGLLRRA